MKTIAREIVATLRKNVTIDWTIRDKVRAQLRVCLKRILPGCDGRRSPEGEKAEP